MASNVNASPITTKKTFCRVCEPACGLLAEVQDEQLIRLRPDKEHPVSKGFVCNKGIYGADMHNDPDRLRYPQKRLADGSLKRISWDTALSEIADKLKSIIEIQGRQALATYTGNPAAFNALFGPSFGNLIRQTGCTKHFGSGTQDCANKFAGAEAVFGTRTIHPVPDIDRSDYILLLGENPAVSHMSFVSIAHPMQHLKDAEERGAQVVFVNPRHIESAHSTGELVHIKPDTDVYLLAAMLNEIEQNQGFTQGRNTEHGDNLDKLSKFVSRYPASRVASVTGIDESLIKRLAKDFAAAPSACAHMSTGVNMGRQGTLAYWLLHMLLFVTGNLGKAGGNFYGLGFYERGPQAGMRVPEGQVTNKFGEMRKPGGIGINLPGVLMADYLLDPEEPVTAMFVSSGNPVLSVAGEQHLREAFTALELLVCVDIYPNATSEYAHYLLPAAGAFEREDINITGLGLQYQPSVQFTEAVVPPQYERKPDWWIFESLSQAMGYQSAFDEVADNIQPNMWSRINAMLRSRGNDMAQLRDEQVLVFEQANPEDFYAEHLPTEHGRIECFPPQFSAALERMESLFVGLGNESSDQLKLISKRDAYMFNSWFSNLDKLKLRERATNYLFMHPQDAAVRQIEDGDQVQVTNEFGELQVAVSLTDELMPGVVAMTHGWGQGATTGMQVAQSKPGVNCNVLMPSGPGTYEPLSNQAHMTGVPVEVRIAS